MTTTSTSPPNKSAPQWFRVLRKWCKFYGEHVKNIFAYMDKDGDGFINKPELRLAMMEIDPVQFQEGDVDVFFECADMNNDGLIDYTEFILKLVSMLLEYNPKHASWVQIQHKWERFNKVKLKEVFTFLDADKDGVINKADLKALMIQLGDEHTEGDIDRLLKQADTNKDGVIDYGEFVTKLAEGIVNFHRTKQLEQERIVQQQQQMIQKQIQQEQEEQQEKQLKEQRKNIPHETFDYSDNNDLRKLFLKMDSDNDGSISKDDFCRVLQEIDPDNYVRDDAEVLYELADIDESGSINYEEFIEHLMESLRRYTTIQK